MANPDQPLGATPHLYGFGVFEADLVTGELRKNGARVKLQGQPFQVLSLLLKSQGKLVSRDELRQKLWSESTFVDFDQSLNVAVRKLREALGDSAENPRFVETLPKRGYRFIALVQGPAPAQVPAAEPPETTADPGHPLVKYQVLEDIESGGDSVVYRAEDTQLKRAVTINVVPESAAREAAQRQRTKDRALVAALALFVAALAVILAMLVPGPAPVGPQPLRRFALTPPDAFVAQPPSPFMRPAAVSPNGRHVAFGSGHVLAGESGLPDPLATLHGRNRTGNDLWPLWIQDLDQQQPREIEGTEGASWPFWSPDSDFIGFAEGYELKKVSVQGGLPVRLCELPGGGGFVGGAWSPDGEVIVFSNGPPFVLYQVPARASGGKAAMRGLCRAEYAKRGRFRARSLRRLKGSLR